MIVLVTHPIDGAADTERYAVDSLQSATLRARSIVAGYRMVDPATTFRQIDARTVTIEGGIWRGTTIQVFDAEGDRTSGEYSAEISGRVRKDPNVVSASERSERIRRKYSAVQGAYMLPEGSTTLPADECKSEIYRKAPRKGYVKLLPGSARRLMKEG